jgi:hypothetical protein
MNALMWSCPIEILDVGTQDKMQLLFTKDQYVIQTLSPDTAQKAFADGIGTRHKINLSFLKMGGSPEHEGRANLVDVTPISCFSASRGLVKSC